MYQKYRRVLKHVFKDLPRFTWGGGVLSKRKGGKEGEGVMGDGKRKRRKEGRRERRERASRKERQQKEKLGPDT